MEAAVGGSGGVPEGVRGEMFPAFTTGEEGLGCSSRLGVIGEI